MRALSNIKSSSLILGILICIGLVMRLVGAWFSVGFWHPDEHFQILEFAAYKLGQISPDRLMWEFPAQIRPWLQPAIAVLAAKALGWTEISRWFDIARLLRIATALLTFGATWAYLRALRPRFRHDGAFLLCAAALLCLYLVPLIQVRFSSETWSMALAMLGLAALLGGTDPARGQRIPILRALACGLLFGLAFVVRFQACLMIGPGLIAMLVARRIGARDFVLISAGIAAAIAAGLAIDAWGYGEMVCSQCNYVRVNFFEGKANEFGVAPWWDYFRGYLGEFTFPAGIMVFCAGLVGMLILWRDPLAWFFIPNVAAHFMISHKEPRFLFPHLFLALPLFFLALDRLDIWSPAGRLRRIAMFAMIIAVLTWNALLAIPAAVSPADDTVGLLEEMNEKIEYGAVLAYFGSSPVKALDAIPYGIYRLPDGVAMWPAEKMDEAIAAKGGSNGPAYLTSAGHGGPGGLPSLQAYAGCSIAWETPANRIARLIPPLGRVPSLMLIRAQPRALYRCGP